MKKTNIDEYFKGLTGSEVIVSQSENDSLKIYGIFKSIDDTKKVNQLINEYDFETLEEMYDERRENGDWCEEVNSWIDQFGTEHEFGEFEPDSDNQTYIDFQI